MYKFSIKYQNRSSVFKYSATMQRIVVRFCNA